MYQNLKKNFTTDPGLDAKSVNFPKGKCFRIKPVDKPISYHSSLSVFQESKSKY